MKQGVATQTIILFCEDTKKFKVVVEEGQHYACPENISVFEGTLEQFKIEYPEYEIPEE